MFPGGGGWGIMLDLVGCPGLWLVGSLTFSLPAVWVVSSFLYGTTRIILNIKYCLVILLMNRLIPMFIIINCIVI